MAKATIDKENKRLIVSKEGDAPLLLLTWLTNFRTWQKVKYIKEGDNDFTVNMTSLPWIEHGECYINNK